MKDKVKKVYGDIAKNRSKSCCGPTKCCSGNSDISEKFGYTKKELNAIPDDANMGLGCGNPVAFATIKEGETIVDLGSGGGIDVFLASKKVSDTGKVIGVDMTEAMVEKAKNNALKGGFTNVEFRLGDIENIPIDSLTADCIISNCVINLAEDKQKVFHEAFRVLKVSGRLMVSDMVLLNELPEFIKNIEGMYSSCIAGALLKDDYIEKIRKAGFKNIEVISEDKVQLLDYTGSDKVLSDIVKTFTEEQIQTINNTVVSIKVYAGK